MGLPILFGASTTNQTVVNVSEQSHVPELFEGVVVLPVAAWYRNVTYQSTVASSSNEPPGGFFALLARPEIGGTSEMARQP